MSSSCLLPLTSVRVEFQQLLLVSVQRLKGQRTSRGPGVFNDQDQRTPAPLVSAQFCGARAPEGAARGLTCSRPGFPSWLRCAGAVDSPSLNCQMSEDCPWACADQEPNPGLAEPGPTDFTPRTRGRCAPRRLPAPAVVQPQPLGADGARSLTQTFQSSWTRHSVSCSVGSLKTSPGNTRFG